MTQYAHFSKEQALARIYPTNNYVRVLNVLKRTPSYGLKIAKRLKLLQPEVAKAIGTLLRAGLIKRGLRNKAQYYEVI